MSVAVTAEPALQSVLEQGISLCHQLCQAGGMTEYDWSQKVRDAYEAKRSFWEGLPPEIQDQVRRSDSGIASRLAETIDEVRERSKAAEGAKKAALETACSPEAQRELAESLRR